MPFYESVFIARQDVSATQVEGLAETFDKVIKDQGGTVTKTESWGLRSLAYRIKKNRKGYYVLLNIDAPAPAILEMERQMRLNEDIIRYLTTRVDALEEGPSAVMRNKERGDDRGRRGGRDDRRPRDRDRDRGRDGKRDRDETKDAKPAAKKDAEKDSAEDAEKAADKDAAKGADKAADKDAAKGADKDAAKAADKADDKGAEKTAKKAAKDEGGEE